MTRAQLIERVRTLEAEVLRQQRVRAREACMAGGQEDFGTEFDALRAGTDQFAPVDDSFAQLTDLFQAISALILITDSQGRVIRFNRACEQTSGYLAEEVCGREFWDVLVVPEEAPSVRSAFHALSSGSADSKACEWHWMTKAGEVRLIACSCTIFRGPDRAVSHVISTGSDITERRQVESALLASEQRFELATEASRAGIWDWNVPTNDVYFSPEWKRQLGYGKDELSNRFEEWQDRLHPDDRQRALGALKRHLRQPDRPFEVEYRLLHRDGSWHWMLDRGMALFDENGKPFRMLGAQIDLTERKQLEQEILEISNREQQRIGQDLHDDLCQWLMGIEMQIHVLARQMEARSPAHSAQAEKIADYVREATIRTRMLAHGLAAAAIETSGLRSALQELVTNTERLFNVRCTMQWADALTVPGDSAALHLYRIVQEAISNAIRHGRARDVEVDLQIVDENRGRLVIGDNGKGISPTSVPNGGIGLRTMRYRAGIIGATIKVAPREHGGTEVVCEFPVHL